MLEVIKPGTEVGLGCDGKIRGLVVSARINVDLAILYNVSWWDGATYHDAWLHRKEFQVHVEQCSVVVGFGG